MIQSFHDNATHALFEGHCPQRFKPFQAVAERKLTQLNNAATLDFLRSPPGSTRIIDQWRVCFRWQAGDVGDVEIVDYH